VGPYGAVQNLPEYGVKKLTDFTETDRKKSMLLLHQIGTRLVLPPSGTGRNTSDKKIYVLHVDDLAANLAPALESISNKLKIKLNPAPQHFKKEGVPNAVGHMLYFLSDGGPGQPMVSRSA
jgi:hypothetical protein